MQQGFHQLNTLLHIQKHNLYHSRNQSQIYPISIIKFISIIILAKSFKNESKTMNYYLSLFKSKRQNALTASHTHHRMLSHEKQNV